MMYRIDMLDSVKDVVKKWKKPNPILFNKFSKLINDIADHPRTGIGHPEPLVGCGDITYSRHIDAHNRIQYDIHDDTVTVLVLTVEGHYRDK